jgi:hypothetical protein
MAEQRIITHDDIIEFWPNSVNISSSKADSAILRAQQADLEPLLGIYLYQDFIEDYNGTTFNTTKYQELYDGKSYTYRGNDRYFRGVRNLLSVYSFVRLSDVSNYSLTDSGMVDKITEESEQKEDYQIRSTRMLAKDDSIRLEKDTLDFITTFRTDYELYWKVYSTDKKQTKTSYNFYKV